MDFFQLISHASLALAHVLARLRGSSNAGGVKVLCAFRARLGSVFGEIEVSSDERVGPPRYLISRSATRPCWM